MTHEIWLWVLLAAFGLVGGIGITALGPGGVLPTIGLFVFTGLAPGQVAGTAIVTHVATGALATGAYTRSGELRDTQTRRTALVLGAVAVPGAALGVLLNRLVSARLFGVLLGVLVVLVALLVWYRERHADAGASPRHPPSVTVAAAGLGVAVLSGIVGVGGPMLTVPILIAFGVPVLESLAAAQAQSIVIAGIGTIGYVAADTIDWTLAAVIGVPELVGVLIGWVVARRVRTRTLKYAIVVALLALGPYLALHG